jgi:hypothetical protein
MPPDAIMDDAGCHFIGTELFNACAMASAEPCTSALMRIGNSCFRFLELRHHLLKRPNAPCRCTTVLAQLALAVFGDLAGPGFALDHGDLVAGLGCLNSCRAARPAQTARPRRHCRPSLIRARTRAQARTATTNVADAQVPRAPARWQPGRGPCRAGLRSPRLRQGGRGWPQVESSACSRMASSSLSRLVPLSAEISTS